MKYKNIIFRNQGYYPTPSCSKRCVIFPGEPHPGHPILSPDNLSTIAFHLCLSLTCAPTDPDFLALPVNPHRFLPPGLQEASFSA